LFFQFDLGDNSSSLTFAASGATGYELHQVNGVDILKLVTDGTQVLGGLGLNWTGTGAKNMLYAQNNAGSNTHWCSSWSTISSDASRSGPNNVIMVGTAPPWSGASRRWPSLGKRCARSAP
jgi:hypothetical protein